MLTLSRNRKRKLTEEADVLLKKLFRVNRSITGEGVRSSLSILTKLSKFDIKEVASGTKCFDWRVPNEWSVEDAFVKDISTGKRVIDYRENNLHLVGYSEPVNKIVSFAKLKQHLHTLPNLPEAIPYRTSYYKKSWGFCLSYNQYKSLNKKAQYQVKIKASLKPGYMTYGETLVKGRSAKEYLLSTYSCHPSLANDNLSGMVLWALLLRELRRIKTNYTYRFVIAPETIGAITYLSKNRREMKNVSGGFVITCVAGPGKFGYKNTFLGNHLIDYAARKAFAQLKKSYTEYPFTTGGGDERQFSSPYFRIPVGTICKDKYYEYREYHTSLDNLKFIKAKHLINTLALYLRAIAHIERQVFYKSLKPYSEPMLGKRGLYPSLGGEIKQKAALHNTDHLNYKYKIDNRQEILGKELDIIRWLMFLSDGKTSLLEISQRSDSTEKQLLRVAKKLEKHKLLKMVRG